MRVRFRIGPFTFGKSGIRLSVWKKGSGFSIPLFNKISSSFGKIKLGFLLFFFGGNRNPQKSNQSLHENKKAATNANEPWTNESDEKLIALFNQGKNIQELSQIFGRSHGAINSRLRLLRSNNS